MAEPSTAATGVFLALHISGGIVGLPIAVATIVASKQVSRHPTLINFCITWFLSSLIYTLLLYAGHIRDDHPPSNLCLAQAAMVAGAFPMTSVAGMALVLHILHGLTASRPWSQLGMETHMGHQIRLTVLVLAPYAAFAGFTISAAVTGLKNRRLLDTSQPFFYCTIDAPGFSLGGPIFSMAMITIMLAIMITIVWELYRKSRGNGEGKLKPSFKFFLLRLVGFALYASIAQAVCALLLSNPKTITPYILQASLPLILFLCVGTQREVLGVWMRCCNRASPLPTRSKSRTALLRNSRPTVTSSFAGLAETVQLNSVHPRMSEYMDGVLQSSQPVALAEAKLRDGAIGITQRYDLNNDPGFFEVAGRQPIDSVAIIDSQQRTITRLLEEAEHLSSAVTRLKDVENNYHRTQNLLVAERQKASLMQAYVDQMEGDVHQQTLLINDLLARNKEIEEKLKEQKAELEQLRLDNRTMSEGIRKSVKKETEWKDKHKALEAEHARLLQELNALKEERDALLDIWSSLESPVDWELQRPKRGKTSSRPPTLPEHLAKRITQRSSTPARTSSPRQLQRRTTGASTKSQRTARLDALDRMRPKLLAISGKMEMSEKVLKLEEVVREQTKVIEELEGWVEEERHERAEELERHRRMWRAARFQGFTPSSSTIPSASTLADALAESR